MGIFSSFFKKKNSIIKYQNISLSSREIDVIFWNTLKAYTWDEYLQLDKYQKVIAYALEGINDISITKYYLKHYQKVSDKKISLSPEIKIKIKSEVVYLKNMPNSIRYIHLCSLIRRYFKMMSLTVSDNLRISMHKDDINSMSIGVFQGLCLHREDKIWDTHYPPNCFNDPSNIRAYCLRDIKKKNMYTTKNISDFLLDEDFDFNIPKYFIDNYILK